MRRVPVSLVSLLAAGVAVASCGGTDETAERTPPPPLATTRPSADTGDVFTEVTAGAGAARDNTTNTADSTDASNGAGSSSTLTDGGPTPVTTRVGTSQTTVPGGGAATTTVGGQVSTGDFTVATGTANIDGAIEPSVQVRARTGASGDVSVPLGTILDIIVPGPNVWDVTEDLDDTTFEYVAVDDVPDGSDDPFPEAGGATIITLRGLRTGTWTIAVESLDDTDERVTLRVTVT